MPAKHWILALSLLFTGTLSAQEGKPTPRHITYLGTIKGEISKVSDGGRKLEVKYKELVTTTKSTTGMTRGTSGKYRPPTPKELVFKEKNQELELRLHEDSVVRLLDGVSTPAESKAGSKKRSKSEEGSESDMQDEEDKKGNKKASTKSTGKKPAEPQHPGKPGTPASLAKGQYIIVSVAREDMPGYSRLIATTIYVLGEK